MSNANDKYKVQFSGSELKAAIVNLHPKQKPDKCAKWYLSTLVEHFLTPALWSLNLTDDEATLIVRVFQDGILPERVQLVDRDVAAVILYDGLDRLHDVEPHGLIEKLKRFDSLQKIALSDAINRFWEEGAVMDTLGRLKQVGLIAES